ncbi:hypothetical protein D3C86_1629130 [compost metagenome]
MALAFHQFAKGLARHVDVDEQLAAVDAPTFQTPFEQADPAIAKVLQTLGSDVRQAFAIVVDGHLGITPGNPRIHLKLKFRQRNVGREQWMGLREGGFFAHIHQRQFFMVQQGLADLGVGADRCNAHRAWLSLDKSQILGRKALE